MAWLHPGLTYPQWQSIYGRLSAFSELDAIFYADAVIECVGELQAKLHLKRSEAFNLVSMVHTLQIDPSIARTRFAAICGYRRGLPESLRRFFLSDPVTRRVSLSPEGIATLTEYTAILRRVLCDKDEFYRLKFGRFTHEERAKRWARKRFYTDLDEEGRIAVLREYWAMPLNTELEKRARKDKRMELFDKYDLRNWDVINAVKKYGDLVRSIRRRPDLVHLFPRENRPAP